MRITIENNYVVEKRGHSTEVVLGFMCDGKAISRIGSVVQLDRGKQFQVEAPSNSEHPLKLIELNDNPRTHYIKPEVFEKMCSNDFFTFDVRFDLTVEDN